jgi:hypothetical protein
VRDHRHVIRRILGGRGAHTRGKLPLGVRRDRLVPSATRNQDGNDFQAGGPIVSSHAEQFRGCCTACITLALLGSTSAAQWFKKSSSGSQANPSSS